MTEHAPTIEAPRQAMASYLPFRGWVRLLPMALIQIYLAILFLLFLVWPINWQIFHAADWAWLSLYVISCYVLLAVGYLLATGRVRRVAQPLKRIDWIIISGAVISFALMFPISQVYTGRWPWEVIAVAGEQGEAYRNLQETLDETTGQRGVIAAIRALFAPLTFAVVPLGLIYWDKLTWFQRGFVGLAIVVTIVISLLRGTDREFADLVIVGTGAMLVALGRAKMASGQPLSYFAKKYWVILAGGFLFVAVAAQLFSDRKSERLGGVDNRITACVNTSNICADIDAPLISWMPLQARFASSLFILSSSSGFYGLQIAMEKDFQPSYGVGHSPATLSVYELITGDDQLKRRTYTYRNGFEGWSELNYWSTLMVWIANDVGFGGALIVILAIGYLFGATWRSATLGRSDAAAVLFCALMITMFYLTANNQLLGSYDGYFIFVAWLIIWLREKRHTVFSRMSIN